MIRCSPASFKAVARLPSRTPFVVSARSSMRALVRELANETRQITAEQRLAARDPDPAHAEHRKHARETHDFLELQDVLARQPHVLLLRHAVLAAEVAAIRDRDPQAAERPRKAIEKGHAQLWIRGGCWPAWPNPGASPAGRPPWRLQPRYGAGAEARRPITGRNGRAVRCRANERSHRPGMTAWQSGHRPSGVTS